MNLNATKVCCPTCGLRLLPELCSATATGGRVWVSGRCAGGHLWEVSETERDIALARRKGNGGV